MTTTAPPRLSLTLAERELAPDVIQVKAPFEDYLDFAEGCPYAVEYINGEIVSMSGASLAHKSLAIRIGHWLTLLFDDDEDVKIYGSNIKIFIGATGDSANADVSMVRGEPDYLTLPSGTVSTTLVKNPVLLVQVLSKSMLAFDLGEKLEMYKQIPALPQVLFVNQHKPGSFPTSERTRSMFGSTPAQTTSAKPLPYWAMTLN